MASQVTDNLSILLVEDDRHIALALQIRLRAAGHLVRLAASVAEALDTVDAEAPDVAVLDINLPDGDGIELMKNIVDRAHDRLVRSILMTASCQPGLREKALDEGACAFLEKPFRSMDLLEAVEQHGSLPNRS